MDVTTADSDAATRDREGTNSINKHSPTDPSKKFDVLNDQELFYYSVSVVINLVNEMEQDIKENQRDLMEGTSPHEQDMSPLCWCIEQANRDGALAWLKATSFLEQHTWHPLWETHADKNALHHRELYKMSADDDHELFRAVLEAHSESLLLPSPFTTIPSDPETKDNPFCIQEDCKRKMYPMHLALMHSMPSAILLEMIRLQPDLASLPNADGDYPLHYAAEMADASVVAALHEAYPPAAFLSDIRSGYLPLHVACGEDEHPRDEVVLFLLRAYTLGATIPDKNGDLAFHRACAYSSLSQSTMHCLLEAYPQVLHFKNKNGQLPLHFLCENFGASAITTVAPIAILRTMLGMHPQAAQQYNKLGGLLPIHLTIYRMQEVCGFASLSTEEKHDYEESMEMVLEVLPEGFDLNYRDGQSPLFLMAGTCQYDFPMKLWKTIIEPHPEVLLHRISDPYKEHNQTYDKDGYTLLALLLAKEDASNHIITRREDLAEGYVLKRTYEVLCNQRQKTSRRRRHRHQDSNYVTNTDGMLLGPINMEPNIESTTATPIRTTGLHRLFYCMHQLRLDNKEEDTLRDIVSNVDKDTTLFECLFSKDSHGNTPLHLLWNTDSFNRSTQSPTKATAEEITTTRTFETRLQTIFKVLKDAGLTDKDIQSLCQETNNRGQYPWQMAWKYSSASQFVSGLAAPDYFGGDKQDVLTLLSYCPISASTQAMPSHNSNARLCPFVYAATAPCADLSATFTLMQHHLAANMFSSLSD